MATYAGRLQRPSRRLARHGVELFAPAALAVAAGAGIVLLPRMAVGACAAAAMVVIWGVGGRTRAGAVVLMLAGVPLLVGAAHYAGAFPRMLSRAQDVVLALGLLALATVFHRARAETRGLAVVLGALLVGGELLGLAHSHGTLRIGAAAAWQDLRWLGALGWGIYV